MIDRPVVHDHRTTEAIFGGRWSIVGGGGIGVVAVEVIVLLVRVSGVLVVVLGIVILQVVTLAVGIILLALVMGVVVVVQDYL